ncbi:carboxypeptidase-like regulatory domain-containing protein, partial [uncultured Muribaculum sp.]
MKRIITLIIAITAVTTAFCREIRGIVVGENGTPLDYVNVVLYRDSIYVTGTVTDTTGAFSLNTDIRGKLTAKISFVGYETYTSAIPNSGNLGTIKLVPTTATLREVVVSVTRPSTTMKGNAL